MPRYETQIGKYTLSSHMPETLRIVSPDLIITLRQLEVFLQLAQGKPLHDAASSLGISLNTAKSHVDTASSRNKIKGSREVKLARRLQEDQLLNDLALVALRAILDELWGNDK